MMGGGGFNPYMGGGGFNPMMGGGFNPYMGGGGFNPMMGGGGFNPYMGGGGRRGGFGRPGMFGGGRRGGFQGYDFNSPIGEAPPGVEPTPPPSISDLFSGLDDDQRNSFFQQFGLAPTPPPIERAPVDERDMFDSGSIPGGPGFSIERQGPDRGEEGFIGTMGGPGYGRNPLGSAGPEFIYDDAGNPIMEPGSQFFNEYNNFLGTSPDQQPVIPSVEPDLSGGFTDGQINIPGIDLERIRESLAKIEPIIPGISLPQPQPMPQPMPKIDRSLIFDPIREVRGPGPRPMPAPMPVKGPRQTIKTSPPKIMPMPQPMPMPGPPVNPFDNPLFSDPGLGGEGGGRNVPMPMPMPAPMPKIRPMPAPMPKIRPMPAPLPRVISDPVRPKPAPITRGIGGVRRMPAGRRR